MMRFVYCVQTSIIELLRVHDGVESIWSSHRKAEKRCAELNRQYAEENNEDDEEEFEDAYWVAPIEVSK